MRILLFFIVSIFMVSCSSISTPVQTGKVSIRTSPSSAIIKYSEKELKKGDLVGLYKSAWRAQGKNYVQYETFIMNGVIEKVMENNYFEVKFERNEEFQEGDKIKKI